MIYTFGHSTLTKEAGLAILGLVDIDVLIDIRSHPTSKWEQWRYENLDEWVYAAGLDYQWWPGLGGWRTEHFALYADEMRKRDVDLAAYSKGKFPKQRIAPAKGVPDGTSWTNQGLWDYQWFQTTPEYLQNIDRLVEFNIGRRVAIMCCEVLWWKCHRSMVADHLAWLNIPTFHLQPKFTGHDACARLERYHPDVIKAWNDHEER